MEKAGTMAIPGGMIIIMAVVGLGLLFIPIGTYWWLKKRYHLISKPVWVGVVVFVIAVLVLERILHAVVLHPSTEGTIALASRYPFWYVIYGALAAGTFEETGRFLAFRYLKKRVSGIQTALAYGIGHGGVEMILVGAMGMVNYIVISVAINTKDSAILSKLPNEAIQSLMNHAGSTTANIFFERLGAFAIQIFLSIIVWAAVNYVQKSWLYPLAIGLHAIVDVPSAMFQAGLISNELIVNVLLWLCVLLLGLFVYFYIGRLEKGSSLLN